jgi:hypothetical protein
MKRDELEHLIRAAAAIVRDNELVVLGSQSILGAFPDAPAELLVSFEADVYPRNRPEGSILIDGAIGEESIFHKTFGYYAHGVAPEVATLPDGWEIRLVRLQNENTGGAIGWCLEPHDLAISKLAAGREKDVAYIAGLLRHQMVKPPVLEQRLDQTQLKDDQRELLRTRLRRLAKAAD